jgi:hypothetical protein
MWRKLERMWISSGILSKGTGKVDDALKRKQLKVGCF